MQNKVVDNSAIIIAVGDNYNEIKTSLIKVQINLLHISLASNPVGRLMLIILQ